MAETIALRKRALLPRLLRHVGAVVSARHVAPGGRDGGAGALRGMPGGGEGRRGSDGGMGFWGSWEDHLT